MTYLILLLLVLLVGLGFAGILYTVQSSARVTDMALRLGEVGTIADELRAVALEVEKQNSTILGLLSRLVVGVDIAGADRAQVADDLKVAQVSVDLAGIERAEIAAALKIAQRAVDDVAVKLADSHDRADGAGQQRGEAGDAAARSGTPGTRH